MARGDDVEGVVGGVGGGDAGRGEGCDGGGAEIDNGVAREGKLGVVILLEGGSGLGCELVGSVGWRATRRELCLYLVVPPACGALSGARISLLRVADFLSRPFAPELVGLVVCLGVEQHVFIHC